MKKASLLLLLMLAVFIPSKAQETIELTFTANAQGGMYCPFDAVNVTNVTRGWTETLAYPDTVLVLNSTVGIGEQQYEEAIHLGEAYPNPFTDETNVPLDMPITGEVSIQVVRTDGTVVATSRNHLEAGSYRVKVGLSSPAMAFLVVTSTQGRQVVRMLCTKSGGRDSITLEPVSREYKPSIQLVRGSKSGEFQPGDMMRYTSVLFDGANTVYSNTITQQQYESEIVTLLFDLTLPDVTTSQVTNITQTSATGGGNVTATGGVSVTERGICWSTSHNPTISSSHASNGLGAGSYTVQMSGLTTGTTYFVRAYAINRFGTAYGNEVNFTTTQIPSYTINVSANPTNGGTVSGGGSYQQGQSCTVIATAANGYSFNNWTENGSVVSTNPNYSFTVNNNRSLVANFSVQAPNTYTINASPNPSDGGVVTGGGTYQQGQSCTVSAVANTGYTFLRWTENGSQVSTNANYTFTVTGNRTLVAQFQLQSFSISATVTPSNSGTVTGGGSYNYGQICTLMATANTGYVFEKWTKNGTQVSTEATYSFTVTESASYVAHFQLQDYTINVSANPSNGGNATGSGSYSYGQSCTLTATANTGYTFIRWTENGNQVSTNASYTFTVTDNRFLVAQFQEQSYTITASANPTIGGNVAGGGSYNYGQSCTVSATAATGFTFTNWTENGNQISTNANYTFTVTGDRTLVAQFQAQSYNISVSASPTNGGSVSGGGNYSYGQSCTVVATAATGYTFTNWTENGAQVSTSVNYTFTVTSGRTLVANFTVQLQAPSGAINGLFSVSATQQVWFSQGNLQYIGSASTPYWKFADNQWDYLGDNGQGSTSLTVDRDLFGWGTSGYNHGAVCYQPWSTNSNNQNYWAYGNSSYNLYDQNGMADWGYNAISNGDNTENIGWRTLTWNEWDYVFNTRVTASGIRYAKACVNNVNGVLLLPDNWDSSHYTLYYTNTNNAEFSVNNINETTWNTYLAPYGCIFIPAAGFRNATTAIINAGSKGSYWSASENSNSAAWGLSFTSNSITQQAASSRFSGYSVRLVQDKTNLPTITTNAVTNITQTTATGGGNVINAGSSTVTARGVCWSTSHNPTVSGNHTTNGTGTGSFTSNITGLTANTMYYVRAYATNSAGTAYGGEVSFTTSTTSTYTISVSTNPTNGGSVTGGGTYQQGQSCTVSATAATGYTFNNWTENGNVVSTNANYTFTVNSNRSLVAHFSAQAPNTYTISVSSNPNNGGSVTGGGTYQQGQSCTVSATANSGYTFLRWTENGNQVSTNASYTFTVTGDRTLVAQFQLNATLPTVTTNPVTIYTQNSALGGGNVTSNGGATITQRGVCWSTSHNPTISDSHTNSGTTGTGEFWVSMMGLTPSTTYYVRAYATNSAGTAYGNEVSFTTYHDPDLPTVTTSQVTNITQTSATGGGNVTSSGNSTVTERGICWSTSHNPMTNDSHLSSGNGIGSFSVNMTGLTVHTTYYVRAYAINDAGTAYGNEISFYTEAQTPIGAINGLFSVSATKQVWFSQGNLQYSAAQGSHQCADGTTKQGLWFFANTQYDVIGDNNSHISSSYSGWIDLFGWATSGWNSGNTYYRPWDSNASDGCLYGPPYGNYNLTGNYSYCDWGRYNAIYNGGNIPGQWRTLTKNEWVYLFETRNASTVNGIANARYAKANVANVQGVVLFPDSYTHPSTVAQPIGINDTGSTGWNGNNYSASDFASMQAAGAVFLPAAGNRVGTSVSGVGSVGCYWTASYDDIQYNNFNYGGCAYRVYFGYSHLETHSSGSHRYCGFSVRLVQDY